MSSTVLVTYLRIQATFQTVLVRSYVYRPRFKRSACYVVMLQATFQAQCLLHSYVYRPRFKYSACYLVILQATIQAQQLLHRYVTGHDSSTVLVACIQATAYQLSQTLLFARTWYLFIWQLARRFASLPTVGLRACELSIQSILGLIKVKRSQYQLIFVKHCLLFKTVISCTSTESKNISFFPQYSSLQLWQIWLRLLWGVFFFFYFL